MHLALMKYSIITQFSFSLVCKIISLIVNTFCWNERTFKLFIIIVMWMIHSYTTRIHLVKQTTRILNGPVKSVTQKMNSLTVVKQYLLLCIMVHQGLTKLGIYTAIDCNNGIDIFTLSRVKYSINIFKNFM